MSTPNDPNSASRYNLRKIEILNFDGSQKEDISHSFHEMQIKESIFHSFMFGHIDVIDSNDIATRFPLIGEETITIEYTDFISEQIRKLQFYTYRVENRRRMTDGPNYFYRVLFCSKEGIVSENILLSTPHEGVVLSDLVQETFNILGTKKSLELEGTDVKHTLVFPNKSPIEAIRWISTFAISKSNPASSYVFFENMDGFHFVTLNQLLTGATKKTYRPVLQNMHNYSPLDKNQGIIDYQLSYADTVAASSQDMFYQQLIAFDPIARTVSRKDYDFVRDYNKFNRLSDGGYSKTGMISTNSIPLQILNNKNIKQQSSKAVITNSSMVESSYVKGKVPDLSYIKRKELSTLGRLPEFSQLGLIRVNLVVPGSTVVNAGNIVEVKIPSVQEQNKSNTDVYFSGKCLVAGVTHVFQGWDYIMRLELMRNSMSFPLRGTGF